MSGKNKQQPVIGLLNGPNLSRLGKREPGIYGTTSLAGIEDRFQKEATSLGIAVTCFQSNCEGAIIDQIEKWTDEGVRGLVINPGGLTHTSIALRDAITASKLQVVEVHLSNIYQREGFRHTTITGGACKAVISGMGVEGYLSALRYLAIEAHSGETESNQ